MEASTPAVLPPRAHLCCSKKSSVLSSPSSHSFSLPITPGAWRQLGGPLMDSTLICWSLPCTVEPQTEHGIPDVISNATQRGRITFLDPAAMLLPREPSLQLAFVAKAPCWLMSNLLPARTIRPFSAKLLPSNSSVLLHGGYSTPNTGLSIFLYLTFTRFLSVHLSLGPTEQRPCPPAYSPLPQAAITCSAPNETEQKHDNLEWPSPCCCSRRDTQVGRGVQKNHYWFSVFFVRLRAYRSQASPL